MCKMLMLPNNDRFVRPNICQREKSSLNTSLVSVAVTDHLRDRQAERAVGRRELQAAKKHGDKFRQPNGTPQHTRSTRSPCDAYGCSFCYVWLQPLLPTVAASGTCGCRHAAAQAARSDPRHLQRPARRGHHLPARSVGAAGRAAAAAAAAAGLCTRHAA